MMATEAGKAKLYEVLKALSAMKLTKEDSSPSPVLSKKETTLYLFKDLDEPFLF